MEKHAAVDDPGKRSSRAQAGATVKSPRERKRMSRLRMAIAGDVEITVRVSRADLIFVDRLAALLNQRRSRLTQRLFAQSVRLWRGAVDDATRMHDHGANEHDVSDFLDTVQATYESAETTASGTDGGAKKA
jgi:hypothetical protein